MHNLVADQHHPDGEDFKNQVSQACWVFIKMAVDRQDMGVLMRDANTGKSSPIHCCRVQIWEETLIITNFGF